MIERPIALTVHQVGACPLLKPGDRWILAGTELNKTGAARLCTHAICSLYPKLRDLIATLPHNATLPDDYLLCDAPGCDAAFRMELTNAQAVQASMQTDSSGVPTVIPASAPSSTRRMERGGLPGTRQVKKSGPFLSRLPKDLAAELVCACITRRFEDGQIIVMQGVVNEQLFIVAEGHVEVVKIGENTDETVLVTLSEGDCFGEMSVLTNEFTSAEVRSRGPSAVLSVHKDPLEELLMKRPALSREFSKLLADRLKATNLSLENELSRGVIGKLSMISLMDLIQTLAQSRQTGTLVLSRFGEQSRLGFRAGAMVTAVLNDMGGEEAFYKAACWPDGDFCFEKTEPSDDPSQQISADNMSLMMEAMRRMDEARSTETK
jgi:CRP-like cAMP-binding protein